MNTTFLETFWWVAKLSSFSGAAEQLNTTQASVSNRIATLERDLGVRLFDRELRSVRLTPDGRRAVEQAGEIVRLTAEFRESISSRESLKGTVRIGSSDTIAYSWLPELIRRMQARYPSVGLDLNIDTSLNIAQQIQEGRVDLGIIMGPVNAPDIRCTELCTYTSCWAASTALDLGGGRIELADLGAYPLLTFSTGSQPHRALLKLLSEAGLEEFRIYNSNSLAIMTRLVEAGVGIGALPLVLVQDLVKAGGVRILEIDPAVPSLTFHVVHQDRGDNMLARVVTDMALEIVAETVSSGAEGYA
ncbi:LysR family transcriptional regulator [Aureimonas sp. SA4125]|uniref:LysR family transcriptional regulator n=1 Tax=Aureimonas sp. SA4125 TaxID=2826993 RepID=UPI001CC7811A|nr:LysR family transcriptional regulator [Aureimonas sp. SA4125]BDA83647.1 LysR family transcriptional regulator [Aureimonas sp. SA4125]